MRNSERRIGLGIDPGMLGYRISPGCWTAHGRHWLPNSACLNTKTLVKLSNISCSSNGGTGSRRAYTKLSWDMPSLPCLNWKSRFHTKMCLSRPIWISRSSPHNLNPQYGFWKSNPPQGRRQRFLGAMPFRSAVRRHCSKPIGSCPSLTSYRIRGKSSTTGLFLKSVTNVLGYPFLMRQLVTFKVGFSASPCAMPKPLARFFQKIRISPSVWIWLPSSGKS